MTWGPNLLAWPDETVGQTVKLLVEPTGDSVTLTSKRELIHLPYLFVILIVITVY